MRAFLTWLLGVGSVLRQRRAQLRRAGNGDAAVFAVVLAVAARALRMDRASARSLLAGAERVSRDVAAAAGVRVRAEAARDPESARMRRECARDIERARLRLPFDAMAALVPPAAVLAVELVVVVLEFTFWYGTWAAEIDRRAPWTAHLPALLLALLTPTTGVAGAWIGGGAAHRVLVGLEVRRIDRWAMIVGLGFCAGATTVMVLLAYWRFTEGAILGAVDVPAGPMAALFGAAVLLIALLRTFGMSQLRGQQAGADRRVRRDARAHARWGVRILRADTRSRATWLRLRARVHQVLDTVDLAAITGSTLVADEAGRVAADVAVGPHRPDAGGYGRPAGSWRPVADRTTAAACLRHVADAIDVLDVQRPAGMGGAERMVAELRARMGPPSDPVDVGGPSAATTSSTRRVPIARLRPAARNGFGPGSGR